MSNYPYMKPHFETSKAQTSQIKVKDTKLSKTPILSCGECGPGAYVVRTANRFSDGTATKYPYQCGVCEMLRTADEVVETQCEGCGAVLRGFSPIHEETFFVSFPCRCGGVK